jgi:hypothetical protein
MHTHFLLFVLSSSTAADVAYLDTMNKQCFCCQQLSWSLCLLRSLQQYSCLCGLSRTTATASVTIMALCTVFKPLALLVMHTISLIFSAVQLLRWCHSVLHTRLAAKFAAAAHKPLAVLSSQQCHCSGCMLPVWATS